LTDSETAAREFIATARQLRTAGVADAARACLRLAVALAPGWTPAVLEVAEQAPERSDEAVSWSRRAARLDPASLRARAALGHALARAGRADAARHIYQGALCSKPGEAELTHDLGVALVDSDRADEASSWLDRTLRLAPDHGKALFARAAIHLARGEWAEGWDKLRRRRPPFPDLRPGSRVLLYSDQGYGDFIQFIRFAPWFRLRGMSVVAGCPRPLLRLAAGAEGVDAVTSDIGYAECDARIAITDLPALLDVEEGTIPTRVPYLRPDADLVSRRRADLGRGDALLIGVAWRGAPGHPRDRERSIGFALPAALARVPGVRLIGLQPDVRETESLPGHAIDFGRSLRDFADTGAVMSGLDLVVSVDSAVAHLAGASGIPVWIAVPRVADWRWGRERTDSPWYPTARLFRQRAAGSWSASLDEIIDALGDFTLGSTRRADG